MFHCSPFCWSITISIFSMKHDYEIIWNPLIIHFKDVSLQSISIHYLTDYPLIVNFNSLFRCHNHFISTDTPFQRYDFYGIISPVNPLIMKSTDTSVIFSLSVISGFYFINPIYQLIHYHTLWWTNIAMENHHV